MWAILSSRSPEELRQGTRNSLFRFDPPTDDDPYFFNLLQLGAIPYFLTNHSWGVVEEELSQGVGDGNLIATVTLVGLIVALAVMTVVTILVPLLLRGRIGDADEEQPPILWAGAVYFSLIGCGFMLLEIAMIQRLSVFLGHPVYALGVLLFAFILSTGIGSYASEWLPLTRRPWALMYPAAACIAILATRVALAC